MGSYFTFAIVLTVLYVIYYAVNIARDLYGKKESGKTDEEVFDLGLVDATEESISVSENETGFSIGSEKYDTEAETVAPPSAQGADAEQEEETAHARFERLKAKAEERMEDSVPLPVRPLHIGGNVQGDGFQRLSGKPSRVEVEACQR